jgi:hypothetical protein
MAWPFTKRKQIQQPGRWDLDRTLLYWADGVPWTIGDACVGTQIFGTTGSGKSSGSLAAILKAMLSAGFGGLLLTAKGLDCPSYKKMARDAGRESDLLIFSPDSPLRYNFIDAEVQSGVGKTGLVENLTALLMTAARLGNKDGGGGRGEDQYFRDEAARLCGHGLTVLSHCPERITIPDLHRLITSAPSSVEQVASADWQRSSFCYQRLQVADRAPKSESQRLDWELVLNFFLNEWAALSSRTRSVVLSTLTSTTDKLSRGAARDMLSSPSPNVSPAMCYDGAIVIADFPVLVYRDIGQLIQVILKFCWQRAHSRRDVAANPRPTFIVADESHLLATEGDPVFQTTARSSRTAVVFATQGITNYLEAFGPQSEAKVHTLLGNLQTQFCHQQTDIKTIQYMQELIGRSRQFVMNSSTSRESDWLAPLFGGGGNTGVSAGFSEQYEFELQASDLNSLAKGGAPDWITEAIVYQGGRRFPNGRTWLRTAVKQSL